MKSHVSVLLHSSAAGIADRLNKTLEKHRLVEDNIESIKAHHWDYWHLPIHEHFSDADLKKEFPSESAEILKNSTYVRNLPTDYCTSAVIAEDGSWLDLQDFGWRLVDQPSLSNNKAMENWMIRLKEVFDSHPDYICVQVITHC